MASKSSKSIPFIILAITFLTISAEAYYSIEIDLESYLPLLIPLGLGGAGVEVVRKAVAMKQKLPDQVKTAIHDEIIKIKENKP